MLIQIGDGHVRPLLREVDGDRTANSRIAARDERDLALQLAARPVLGGLVERLGRHLPDRARLLLLMLARYLIGPLLLAFQLIIPAVVAHRLPPWEQGSSAGRPAAATPDTVSGADTCRPAGRK